MNILSLVTTKGLNILARKDHCAAIIGKTMIVYGGCFQNNVATAELLGFDLEYNDWSRFQHTKMNEPLSQVQCTVVTL